MTDNASGLVGPDGSPIDHATMNRRNMLTMNLQAGLLALGAAGLLSTPARAAEGPAKIPKVFRIFDGPDGVTTSEECGFGPKPATKSSLKILEYANDKEAVRGEKHPVIELLRGTFPPTSELRVVTSSPSQPDGYHCAKTRELVYFIQGHWEFVPKSGKVLNIHPGDFLWAEDTEKGGGHTTRVVGPEWGLIIAIYGVNPV